MPPLTVAPEVHINHLAVFSVVILQFMLGGLWYSPLLFAKAWIKAQGKTMEEIKAAAGNPGPAYGITFAGQIVLSYVFAHMLASQGVTTWSGGAVAGLLVWVGFIAPVTLSDRMFTLDKTARRTWPIDTSYRLVATVVAGTILAAWH